MNKKKPGLNALPTEDFITGIAQKVAEKVNDKLAEKKFSAEDFEKYRGAHRFDINKVPPPDSTIFYYKGLPIGDRQNIVVISGKAKSRKTVIASAMASAAFVLKSGEEFLGFSCQLKPDERVLHIDTEQGYSHYYKSVTRIFANVDRPNIPARFESYHTRDATTEFRLEYVEYLIQTSKPSVVILDGVADLVYDIGSQEEATRVGERVLSWSSVHNCLIIVVIHTTQVTNKLFGPIGTYLEKKSQTVIKVVKPEEEGQDQYSHISCPYCRDKAFQTFTIEYDEKLNRYGILNEQNVPTKGRGGRTDPPAYADEIHELILKRAFQMRTFLSDWELRTNILRAIEAVTKDKIVSGKFAAWKDYYQGRTWIFKNPDNEQWMKVETKNLLESAQPRIDFESPRTIEEVADAMAIGLDDDNSEDLDDFTLPQTDDLPF